ncbi:MAG: hypothetical protein H6Q73_1613 [Firmicutes bacterium]|nr:hypothetical protein [Bacillota bacterium]
MVEWQKDDRCNIVSFWYVMFEITQERLILILGIKV